MTRDEVISILWLLAAAIIIGFSIGMSARAEPAPPVPCTIDVPELNGTP